MGIEFAYSAETAFVSPTLLGIGIQHRNMVTISIKNKNKIYEF